MLHRRTSSCRTVLARDLWISRKCQRALQFYEILLLSRIIDNVDISFTCCFSPLISPCLLTYSGWNKKKLSIPGFEGRLGNENVERMKWNIYTFSVSNGRAVFACFLVCQSDCEAGRSFFVGGKEKGRTRISEMDKHQLQRNFHLKTLDGWAGCGDGGRWCTPRSIKTRIHFSLFTKLLQEFLRFFFSSPLIWGFEAVLDDLVAVGFRGFMLKHQKGLWSFVVAEADTW